MRLLRVGPRGSEKPAALDSNRKIRDLSSIINDVDGVALAPDSLAILAATDLTSLPELDAKSRIGACVAKPGKVICIGLNYSDHAAEAGMDLPTEPVVFMKATSAVCGPNDSIEIPRTSEKCDWEVELGVVIGSRAKYISEDEVDSVIAGYCTGNDLSERAFQLERLGTWDKGKSHDSFAPLGPYLVTKDEIPDPQNLKLWTRINGETLQNGNTSTMVFNVRQIVAYLSNFMTLEPGDVILTGTPPGVGMGQKPPSYLKAGDRVEIGIEGLGEQDQTCIQA
ncbi:fumarylacetoacetate hydrolase family protein [Marinobacterium sp. LSUCC0821]|jgi:2-keto-4-pentenoate hydratase/2-oxohepta-3-ene-1,7-dioic acid hydratase in catechol pathway|uniref:fumarylacetoacetate hydrolase family protein n=1 Tax=Marinobacterium sp. LSUCC0821 TaxID=2668067 RepID=UPI00145290CD|nr:fumarylacetoacetate hydrolase family protein [Marinobacterium sp. LSUCC0821]QJD71742.1 fumarylacetoacetate hydrolase family protein [Marinobacterium sp. LSUCC0821]